MVTIDQAKQLDYAQTRREYTSQIARNAVLKPAQQCCEDFNSRVADKAETIPKQGFNGA